MLRELIDTIEGLEKPITASELAQRVGLQPSALEPMLDLLASNGLLERPASDSICTTGCSTSCSPSACPLLVGSPGGASQLARPDGIGRPRR